MDFDDTAEQTEIPLMLPTCVFPPNMDSMSHSYFTSCRPICSSFQQLYIVMPNRELVMVMTMALNSVVGLRFSGLCCYSSQTEPKNFSFSGSMSGISCNWLQLTNAIGGRNSTHPTSTNKLFQGRNMPNGRKGSVQVMSPNKSPPSSTELGLLDAYDDEYGGVIINPECLPSSANAFASILRASLLHWKLKGKKGIWLKMLPEQADLLPIAIKEGFNYHHAEPEYIMLTCWLPGGPCLLPDGPSHQIGVGGFVINENREVLVVKEKLCPCRCLGVWKLPTGYINKSEEIFSGVVREVKEETGIDTDFLEVVAFRHAHRLAFEKSDLFFVCMLNPLSFDITIDEKEIQAAKWMPLDEFIGQSFYQEDHMSKKAIDMCIATYEKHYSGFIAHQLTSKFDGNLSYLYYNDFKKLQG